MLLVGDGGTHTQKGKFRALVVNGPISNPRYRPRPLPTAPLVVRLRELIVVPRPPPPGAETLSQQEKNNSSNVQRKR
jgi:hypothetical protein